MKLGLIMSHIKRSQIHFASLRFGIFGVGKGDQTAFLKDVEDWDLIFS